MSVARCRRGLLASVSLGFFAWGCDSSVFLDTSRPSFSKVVVAGACAEPGVDNLSIVNLSVLILGSGRVGPEGVLPDQRLAGRQDTIGNILVANNFSFALPEVESLPDVEGATRGFAQLDGEAGQGTAPQAVDLQARSVRFEFNGGEERRNEERLVVLLLDNSGSLEGLDVRTGEANRALASDPDDRHITFFRSLIESPRFPGKSWFSLVSFQQSLVKISPEFSSPTMNKDVISNKDTLDPEHEDGLGAVEKDQSGQTPLARGLIESYLEIVNAGSTSDLNPIVVLFTDGVEEGDSSSQTLEEAKQLYVNHAAGPVPIIILHLNPPATVPDSWQRGRSKEFYDLACATGGEYIFIERAEEFQNITELEAIVRNRVVGSWKVEVTTTLDNDAKFPPANPFLISTELQLDLNGVTRSTGLYLSRDPSGDSIRDSRLWLYKN